MNKKILFSIIPLFLFGCDPKSETDQKAEVALQKKVFVVHDKLMSRMDELVNIEKKLKGPEIKKIYLSKNSLNDTASFTKKVKQINDSLESANDAMMNWMEGFKVDYKGKNHEATMNYLEEQLKKVNSIDSRFNLHFKSADSLLSIQK